jgi:hypothetical protein
VRNCFSYILLISLLFPTVVETFHAIYDHHDIHTEEKSSIHNSEFHCQITLFSNLDDDIDFFLNNLYESISFQKPRLHLNSYKVLKLNTDYSFIHYSGPPVKI